MREPASGGVRAGAIAQLTLATLFWAGNYLLGAIAVAEVDPLSLTLLRWLPASLLLLAIAQLVERPDWRLAMRSAARMALLGALGMIGFVTPLYEGLRHTTTVNASLISAAAPPLIAAAAAIWLRERTGWRLWAGLGLSLAGIVLVVTKGSPAAFTGAGVNVGDLWVMLAVALWTAYTVLGRRPTGVPPITATALQAVAATLLVAPFVAVSGLTIPVSAAGWGAVAFIAVLPSVGSYLLWNLALRRVPAGLAGIMLNLISVFVVAIAVVVGTPVLPLEWVGGAVILAGVLLATLPTARARGR